MRSKQSFVLIRNLALAATGVTLVSCGATLGEYKKFADAGQEYSAAIDTLLVSSADIYIEARSEELLRQDLQNPDEDLAAYSSMSRREKQWLSVIAKMRQHANLLRQYFLSLQELANSDAPSQARQASEKIFQQLNSIGQTIEKQTIVLSSDQATVLSGIPELIISEKIKGELRAELMTRKQSIYRQLTLQDLVLKLLKAQIESDLQLIQDSKDNRLLLLPYASQTPIANPDAWIEKRRTIRQMELTAESLGSATKASEEFKEGFELLLQDKFTLARANELLSSVNSLLKAALALKGS